MRHSIQLLGMSTKDLNEYVESAIETNPFLKKAFEQKRVDKHRSTISSVDNVGTSYEQDRGRKQDEDPRASLLSQLRMLDLDGKSIEIAEHLIYEIDHNGYIPVAIEEVAHDLLVSIEEVEGSLKAIQSLDPPGIGARDVCECLQLQLKRINKEGSLEYAIVSEFINELARADITKIAKKLNVDKEKVQVAINAIKKLNPRPASTMLSKGSEKVIPDLVATAKNEKIRLEINREWLPHLRLYNPYEEKLDIIKDPEARKFMKENMNSARHLIDGLKRREETMCKVADYILNFHGDETIKEKAEMKSLTVKDISSALELHPSTITRTVSNKYIQIEDKVVPLKSFLSHGIKKENGELASKTVIKKKISELVKSENKSRPLSDQAIQKLLGQAIQKLLGKEGILIKRRTIAKYRTALRILPTHLRKKLTEEA
jgi:RNA polymerase sigma-54 factor